jgi:HPt (histidine-containing phosphotransfer) domain-containing protein
VLRRQPPARPAAEDDATEEADSQQPDGAAARLDLASVDWDAALDTFEGSHTLLRLATEAFLEEHPKMVDAIRAAVDAGDAASLRVSAHTLKGALRYFGSVDALERAYQIELAAETGVTDGCRETLAALETELGRLIPAVEEYVRDGREMACPPGPALVDP